MRDNLSEFKLQDIAACPLCESSKYQDLYKANDRLKLTEYQFKFVKCNNCNLVFQNPRVDPKTVSFFYQEDYFNRRKVDPKKIQIKYNIVKNNVNHVGTLIEIGSANGDFLYQMEKMGWYVEGVELSYEGVKHSKNKYNIKNIHFGELVEREDNGMQFDVAVLWGVLPHIWNPVQTIKYLSNILNKSGKIIITCANIDGIPAKIMKYQWGHLDLPRHYCMWSPKTLQRLLETNDMYIDKVIFHDDLWNSNIDLFKFKLVSFSNNMFSSKVLSKIQKYAIKKVNRLLTHPLLYVARLLKNGGMMTIVGAKK